MIHAAFFLPQASASLERLALELEEMPDLRLSRMDSLVLALAEIPDIMLLVDDGSGTAVGRVRAGLPALGLIALLEDYDDAGHRTRCIENGADMVLPCHAGCDEVLASMRAVCRRSRRTHRACWTLRLQSRRLLTPDGGEVRLSTLEYRVVRLLAAASPEPVPRQALSAALGFDYVAFDERRLEAIVSRLRRKLPQPVKANRSPLRSARLHGYAFAEPIGIDSRH